MSEIYTINKSEEVRSNEFVAFEHLFRTHYSSLCRYAGTIVNSPYIAEDVVQGVFERLWKDRGRIDFEKPIKSYLFQSVYTKSLDALRRESTRLNYNESVSLARKDRVETPGILSELNARDLEMKIRHAIDKLPEKQRDVFEMNRFSGMTYADIAKELRISKKAVEARMSTALKKLRCELGEFLSTSGFILFLIDIH
ncbi:DNA-directed RNA polymerase sigma-70 factor (plasmid) [Fulvitalea axinellae]|uniref:DNA-directed RNA polymerase sigma-70 factor n=1 Tax=Fulvitalea axinellae TaxID=1182444 RepID=A0AAU9CPY4_9BACT|nr:DNA-directed RNA polymerase sigma-70 factor [Fulvitalea axinellae]